MPLESDREDAQRPIAPIRGAFAQELRTGGLSTDRTLACRHQGRLAPPPDQA